MLQKRKVLPPLDYLLAFESAALKGSFAAASRDMNISETAISRKVRLLELHYDVPLFVRGHRSINLTPQGHTLLATVTVALDDLRNASREMFSQQQQNAVTLAATNSVATLWLMPRLRKFNRSNARVKINLVASDNDAECLAETTDLAILHGSGTWPDFQSRLLFGETVFPVCSPGYLKSNPSAADIDKIASVDIVEVSNTQPRWLGWKSWLEKMNAKNFSLDRSAMFNTYPLAIQAAVNGFGVALGWGHLVDQHLDSGTLVRPLGDPHVRTDFGYYLLQREKTIASPESKIVQDWLIQASASRKRYTTAT